MQVRAGTSESAVLREVRGVDYERVAFPMPDGVAGQIAYVPRRVRTPAQWHDPGAVDHLVEDHHMVGRLNDLHVVVVRARHHGRSGVEAQDAAFRDGTVLRVVKEVLALRLSLLRFGRQ